MSFKSKWKKIKDKIYGSEAKANELLKRLEIKSNQPHLFGMNYYKKAFDSISEEKYVFYAKEAIRRNYIVSGYFTRQISRKNKIELALELLRQAKKLNVSQNSIGKIIRYIPYYLLTDETFLAVASKIYDVTKYKRNFKQKKQESIKHIVNDLYFKLMDFTDEMVMCQYDCKHTRQLRMSILEILNEHTAQDVTAALTLVREGLRNKLIEFIGLESKTIIEKRNREIEFDIKMQLLDNLMEDFYIKLGHAQAVLKLKTSGKSEKIKAVHSPLENACLRKLKWLRSSKKVLLSKHFCGWEQAEKKEFESEINSAIEVLEQYKKDASLIKQQEFKQKVYKALCLELSGDSKISLSGNCDLDNILKKYTVKIPKKEIVKDEK